MSVKIQSAAEAAGVDCPKRTGEMDKNESCKECPYYARCRNQILGAILGGSI